MTIFVIQQSFCSDTWVTVGNRLTREDAERAVKAWTEETQAEYRIVEVAR